MIQLCILCKDNVVDNVRKTGKLFGKDIMKIPVSENGIEPATHWFCFMVSTEHGFSKIKENRKDLIESGDYIIEVSNDRDFLKKYNLKIIHL